MGTKNNVFASRSERDNFYKLCKVWGDKYRIYHNLPFLNVFDTKNLADRSDWKNPKPFELTEYDIACLKKTSIDYTLCDEKDSPIVCIEFDGIQQGFNAWTKYYPGEVHSKIAPWRKVITEIKLRVAFGSDFPYFVVCSKYFQDIPAETNLTIVDGIIGRVLVSRVFEEEYTSFRDHPLANLKKELAPYFYPPVDEFGKEIWRKIENYDLLSQREVVELLEVWLHFVNIRADEEHDPVYQRISELERELAINIASTRIEMVTNPYSATGDDEGIRNAILLGARAFVETPDFGVIKGEVWIANFGFWVVGLAQNIAHIYALERIKQMRRNKQRQENNEHR